MTKIEFTIVFSIDMIDSDVQKIKNMHHEGVRLSQIVRFIKDEYNLGLMEANSIRKVILQGTNEFDCELSKTSNTLKWHDKKIGE